MRAIWNGMITFGLVNIPVGLYPATEDNDLAMHLLHEKDGGRIKNQRVCTKCGEIVEYEDLVKGYEYEKDNYVTITDEDLDKVKVEATENIVIEDFVLESEIDPMYFEKPYYLLPGKKSEAAYAFSPAPQRPDADVGYNALSRRNP
jgi:DNA end-binding protein Ku